MDFDFSEEDQAIYDLTAQILGDKVTDEHLRELAAADVHLDRTTWLTLAEAGIVGAALPEAHGGSGLGFMAVSAVCELVGRHAATVPMLETVVMVGLPIAEFGTDAQRADVLPRIASGELVATAALVAGDGFTRAGDTVSGSAPCVPMGLDADLFLVPTDDGVVLVDADASGLTRVAQRTTTDHPQALLTLDATPCTRLGTASTDEILTWLRLRVDRRSARRWPVPARPPPTWPPSTPRSATSSTVRSPRSRPSASAPVTPTSTPRVSTSPHARPPGALPTADPPHARSPSPAGGRARRASGWCTRPRTSTAAWVSIATIPSTATT